MDISEGVILNSEDSECVSQLHLLPLYRTRSYLSGSIFYSLRTTDVSPTLIAAEERFLLTKRSSAAMSDEKRLPFAGYIFSNF